MRREGVCWESFVPHVRRARVCGESFVPHVRRARVCWESFVPKRQGVVVVGRIMSCSGVVLVPVGGLWRRPGAAHGRCGRAPLLPVPSMPVVGFLQHEELAGGVSSACRGSNGAFPPSRLPVSTDSRGTATGLDGFKGHCGPRKAGSRPGTCDRQPPATRTPRHGHMATKRCGTWQQARPHTSRLCVSSNACAPIRRWEHRSRQ